MNGFRKSLIVCFVAASFVIAPLQTLAWRVSAAGSCSVPNVHPDGRGFYYTVKSFPEWYGRYYANDYYCTDLHYKRKDLGGLNNNFIDRSDIHYHVGHGAVRWDGHYDKYLTAIICQNGSILLPSEARGAWGEIDIEWIGFRNCKLLDDTSRNYWAKAMNGIRLILGFKTSCYTHDKFGQQWAQKMRSKKKYSKDMVNVYIYPGMTITQAWFSTTDWTQPGGTTACVIAEWYPHYGDHLWGNGSTSPHDPPKDNYKHYWDHTVPYPPQQRVNSLSTMNVYEIVPRDVNDQYVRSIGTAFDLAADHVVEMCDSFVMADLSDSNNPKILEVSKMTGHFNYHEDGKLFAADPTMGQCPEELAHELAESFLADHGLIPDDADTTVYNVGFDTITEVNIDTNEVVQTLYQNTSVAYAREIFADSRETTKVSVAGAGARLIVYLTEDESIIGTRGNWRNVEVTGSINVNDSNTTWSFFDTYGEKVAIEPALVEYDEAIPDYATATQLYYEYSSHRQQTELIPCWMFEVDYYLDDELVLTANTFIPAAQSYMPPVVEIIKPAEFKTFEHGEMADFNCQVEAGFGTPPYTYIWESSVDGFLSTQKTFQTDQLSIRCPDESLDCSPLPHAITVTVTDEKGFQASDTIQITVNGPCDECADPADLDHSGTVDMIDFAHWANRYLTQTGHEEQ
jgi:hypothetical protein